MANSLLSGCFSGLRSRRNSNFPSGAESVATAGVADVADGTPSKRATSSLERARDQGGHGRGDRAARALAEVRLGRRAGMCASRRWRASKQHCPMSQAAACVDIVVVKVVLDGVVLERGYSNSVKLRMPVVLFVNTELVIPQKSPEVTVKPVPLPLATVEAKVAPPLST